MTTKINIKRALLLGTLILSLSGMVGCSTNDSQQETEDNKKTVELQPNELSFEETRALKPGDIVPEGKEVNRELLEQQGMDYVCFYNIYVRKSNGDKIAYTESTLYTYDLKPAEAKINGTIHDENGEEISDVYNVYTLDYIEIVPVEFVYDESNDTYKKQITYGEGEKAFIDIIDENNVRTAK